MKAKVRYIRLPADRRTICISDIHGHYDLFVKLLDRVGYTADDTLVLLGDLYAKGPKGPETLTYVMELAKRENVYILRGNHEVVQDWHSDEQRAFIESLPQVLDAGEYLFVHGGLPGLPAEEQDAYACMKNDNYMEKSEGIGRWMITGHWPAFHYNHEIICQNPFVNEEKKIIAIDGGCVTSIEFGQLNAFIIENGEFSFAEVDALPQIICRDAQTASGGTFHPTWMDRYIEEIEHGETFSLVRHKKTGRVLQIPTAHLWTSGDGQLCTIFATDYYLPIEAETQVGLIFAADDAILIKHDGYIGWYRGEYSSVNS